MNSAVRILTIEDELMVRESIVAYLEDSGYVMLQAENGRRGIEIVDSEQPDLILCDLRMPEVDGLEVLAKVRRELPETPIIIVSGTGVIADAIEALKLGAWDFITKPIEDMAVLEHAVEMCLERSRLLRENREYRDHLEDANKELRRSLRRLEEEVEAGRRIQVQLLPDREKTFGTYRFQSWVFPSAYLSGDFLDYFAIDDTHLGFYIADVSGHGVSSAFVTVLLKSFMSQYCDAYRAGTDQTILQPAEILRRLNTDLVERDLGKYLTMFYAVLDTQANHLIFSNGGHYPAPIVHSGESVEYLYGKTHPVGLFDQAEYHQEELNLSDEFSIALFSDGIFEVLAEENIRDKEDRLLSLVKVLNGSIDSIAARAGLEEGMSPPDDITLVVVTKRG